MKRFLRKVMKQFHYGEKGFTLIELLVVIAILGVLAAVVVPNVSRFMGRGRTQAALTELHNVQTAVTAMMADQSPALTSINSTHLTEATRTNDMEIFPDSVANSSIPLYPATGNKYIQKRYTQFYYAVDTDGAVSGWYSGVAGTADPIQ